ncbi:MAG: transporter substrate-binding domain-containing protein [Pseudomonadota bacterium]
MKIFLSLLITLSLSYNTYASDDSLNDNASTAVAGNTCAEIKPKDVLIGGWDTWEPYQMEKSTDAGTVLTGMDIEIVNAIMSRLKIGILQKKINWDDNLKGLETGALDLAYGALYSDERAKYAYYSIPYRFEVNSLFTLRDAKKNLSFANIQEFLAQIRLQDYRLGVVNGFVYASSDINNFIKDPANKDIVISFPDDISSFQALMRGGIDGFITDRVVGAAIIMSNRASNKAKEIPLHIQSPSHLMLSKKTVSVDIVEKINSIIANLLPSNEYQRIVRNYLYPTLLLQTIGSDWFYLLGIIGTIAFAISGVAIAAKDNTTLIGAFIFAFLPSVGGGVVRDVMLNRDQIGIFLTPSYIYYIIIIVLIGFAVMKVLNKEVDDVEDNAVKRIWGHTIIICDAIGQASLIVIGVAVVIMGRVEPIELWGPFFAFLTANGGVILRDSMRKDNNVGFLSGDIDAEVSIIWGAIFSICLSYIALNPDPDTIQYTVYFVVAGSIATRLGAYYFKLPNLRFR